MKIILKLFIAIVIINGTVRAGVAAWEHYEMTDAAQQVVLFGTTSPVAELKTSIVARADRLQVPISAATVHVHRRGTRTWADSRYARPVELFPNFKYPLTFSFEVEAFSLGSAAPEDTD